MHFEVCVYLDLYTVPSVFGCSGVSTNRYLFLFCMVQPDAGS